MNDNRHTERASRTRTIAGRVSRLANWPKTRTDGPPNRRDFLGDALAGSATLAGAGVAAGVGVGACVGVTGRNRAMAADPSPVHDKEGLGFFVIGDTHYLADREQPAAVDPRSSEICGRLVDTLNNLPGTAIPEAAGGGKVGPVRGVIHAGDVIDTGDKQGGVTGEMQRTEWAAFTRDYGLTGRDGRLKIPVYEVWGNHDSPHGKGYALEQIAVRNKTRPDVVHISANGLHYAWDWGPAHFINLGLIVGGDRSIARRRRYAALDSLDFLVADLKDKVGKAGRPVIITHHVDIARYTTACDLAVDAGSKEWDPCDVRAFHAALQGYNVAAIFYGHTHARNVFRWDGQSPKAQAGIPVFNTDNASHFAGNAQAFFYVELRANLLTVREYQTKDRWATGFFTPQTWTAPVVS